MKKIHNEMSPEDLEEFIKELKKSLLGLFEEKQKMEDQIAFVIGTVIIEMMENNSDFRPLKDNEKLFLAEVRKIAEDIIDGNYFNDEKEE